METFHFVLRMCGACANAGVSIVQVTLAFFGLAAPYESNFGFVLSWFSFSPSACGTATEKLQLRALMYVNVFCADNPLI